MGLMNPKKEMIRSIMEGLTIGLYTLKLPRDWDRLEIAWLIQEFVNTKLDNIRSDYPDYQKRRRRFIRWFVENVMDKL